MPRPSAQVDVSTTMPDRGHPVSGSLDASLGPWLDTVTGVRDQVER
jgi:hypothetical protein